MRNRSLSLLAALVVALLPACSNKAAPATASPADEQAVRALTDKYADAFNKRDAKAFGALLTDDYEDVDPTGKHTQGRTAAEQAAAADWGGMPADVKMAANTTYVRWLSGTAAVAGGTWQMTGTPAGMPGRGAWMGVVVKKDSTWQMASSLGSADMPMPTMMADSMKPKGKGK